MKNLPILSLVLLAILGVAGIATADHKAASAAPDPADATLAEIEHGLGFVPAFMRQMPRALLPGWWEETKALEMNPKTALSGKAKELIGLAVAAQIPCEYCVYFHSQMARLNGATDQEIGEAVGMAALTRFGSTIMNGLQVDAATYHQDVDHVVKNVREGARK
jgi:AhpD family alkylhydroperoxidase